MQSQSRIDVGQDCGADDCASGKRNRFFRYKTMRAEEFAAEQAYSIERRRLISRAVLGWGVVYGFGLSGPPVSSGRCDDAARAPDHPHDHEAPHSQHETQTALPVAQQAAGGPVAEAANPSAAQGANAAAAVPVTAPAPASAPAAAAAPAPATATTPAAAATPNAPAPPAAPAPTPPAPQPSVTPAPVAISVAPGFGLDAQGREVLLGEATTLSVTNTFLFDRTAGNCCARSVEGVAPGRYVLAIHYAERPYGDAHLPQGCGCDQPERNFVCETAVFSLRALTQNERCPCGDPPCRTCHCGCDACRTQGRGPHACLCQWLTGAKIAGSPRALCEWKGFRIDPSGAIDLACVTVASPSDKCAPLVFASIDDACGPRRLVKSNELLYDLQRGCDLTRIESISWGQWHRRRKAMPWPEFIDMLGTAVDPDHQPRALTKFRVRFSGPVLSSTVTRDCFAIWFTVTGEDTGWHEKRVVPLADVHLEPTPANDPPHTTREVQLAVQSQWQQEVLQRAGKLRSEGATVHIEVNGDYILDCHGQAVDANARGYALFDDGSGKPPLLSGNGSPGGTFVSVFRIEHRTRRS